MRHDLAMRKESGALRQFLPVHGGVDFCSNDYLGLARSTQLKNEINQACQKHSWANGSSGSRLVTGNHAYVQSLEKNIAKRHGGENSLIFPNGYMANLGLYSAIGKRGDTFLIDEFVHASIIDGCRLSFGVKRKFKHNDLSHLETLLRTTKGKKWVVVESIYSMSGDIAPIAGMIELVEQYNAELIVDEAHAVGLEGPQGAGIVSDMCMQKNVFAQVITYGKAFGVSGAAIIGSDDLKQYLINYSRPFIYSTAPPPSFYISIACAYEFVARMEAERFYVRNLKKQFNAQMQADNFRTRQTESAIAFIQIFENYNVLECQQQLKEEGINVIAMRHPTVPKGKEGLRICFHAFNTLEQLTLLTTAIRRICEN